MARGVHCCSSKEDFDVLKRWNIPASLGSHINQINRSLCCWSFPPNEWFKANFDGAAKGNLGPARYGGVIRNGVGFCTRVVAYPLGIQTNHMAEAMGALQAIKLASNLGVKMLWLEDNSKSIIHYLLCNHQPSWTIKNIIESAKELLQRFKKCHITRL